MWKGSFLYLKKLLNTFESQCIFATFLLFIPLTYPLKKSPVSKWSVGRRGSFVKYNIFESKWAVI